MDQLEHIIDPDGEVTIELRNANAPFAEWEGEIIAPNSENSGLDSTKVEDNIDQTQHNTGEDLTAKCFRIQVSAKHLMLASPVFKKLLGGGWKDNVAFLQKGSVEITAEGWDIEAFLILLRAMHCQHNRVPLELNLEMLAKVAVLVDYYQCKEVIGIYASIWIKALDTGVLPDTYSRDLFLWLWISWFFNLSDQFKQITSTAMSLSNGLIGSLGLPIPDKVLRRMNHTREKSIINIVSLLHDKSEAFLSGKEGCSFECSSILYGALTKHLHSAGLSSPICEASLLNTNYKKFVEDLNSFKSPEWFDKKHDCGKSWYGGKHRCMHSNFIFRLKRSIDGFELDNLITLNE